MADDNYDVIIPGASFAGLAAAGQLTDTGRVLLVDHRLSMRGDPRHLMNLEQPAGTGAGLPVT
ncbi:hypothetical protein [Amycolatopsis tucumanensis]|uniref:Uncharacterized protein n=1 Tax=Amycolatopsis tucumanensis TaxID=401106 RepID=A0ABP7JXH8_9PSEU|nr:hypothetical protein [Amycolatopsis tucumanensis]MCF6428512.1 hypothetical protein [Amycolatopsis tucumanensis]